MQRRPATGGRYYRDPMVTAQAPAPSIGKRLLHELRFALLYVPVSLAPVALMALILGLDAGDHRERTAMLIGALSSLIAVVLVHRLYPRRLMEESLREALAAQAHTDVLTGLGNRRRLYEDVERELSRAARADTCVSLLLVDLDGFKQINDRYGHATGDEVIIAFARAAARATRQGQDGTYRMGGDEFTVVLPGADRERAAQIARRLRTAYREEAAALRKPVPVDCSIGVACRRPAEDSEAVDAWVSRADAAMYVAKRGGGGVAVAADPRLGLSEVDALVVSGPRAVVGA